jgi:hypothetical protein
MGKKIMILVVLTKTRLQINWVSVVFNNVQKRLKDLSNFHKSTMTKDAEFRGAQILVIMFQKWFLVDSSFQVLESEEDDESKENLPTDAKGRIYH